MLWHTGDYEDKFADALMASIRPDDCVWDVGANVGFYTESFSKRARHVVAFEPMAENWQQIQSRMLGNVDCIQVALGDMAGEVPIFGDRQFSSVALAPYPGAPRRTVQIARGDDFSALPRPTVVKIDVEGYEVEVVRGMSRMLGGVRALFVEVHFEALDKRGMRHAPTHLVNHLKRLGFTRIEWPDASHLAAFRA